MVRVQVSLTGQFKFQVCYYILLFIQCGEFHKHKTLANILEWFNSLSATVAILWREIYR
jgi:hypothetical protein